MRLDDLFANARAAVEHGGALDLESPPKDPLVEQAVKLFKGKLLDYVPEYIEEYLDKPPEARAEEVSPPKGTAMAEEKHRQTTLVIPTKASRAVDEPEDKGRNPIEHAKWIMEVDVSRLDPGDVERTIVALRQAPTDESLRWSVWLEARLQQAKLIQRRRQRKNMKKR